MEVDYICDDNDGEYPFDDVKLQGVVLQFQQHDQCDEVHGVMYGNRLKDSFFEVEIDQIKGETAEGNVEDGGNYTFVS